MIFLIKHHWWLALIATAVLAAAAWFLGGWRELTGGPLSLPWQVAAGLGGGAFALMVNGLLHEGLTRGFGAAYLDRFDEYRRDILGAMGSREYLAGGLMAALGEEPLFRGVLMRQFNSPVAGILVAGLVFALCHWLKLRYFGFWLWGLWEGVLFGILLAVTGSLLVPIIAHGLHDVTAYRIMRSLTRKDVKQP